MRVDHWMLFSTFAQRDHFKYPSKETYRGVIINANMVAHAPDGLAAFLLERTASASYLIDPLTHAFQHDPRAVSTKDGELKPALRSLAQAYGEPATSQAGKRPLTPGDFRSSSSLLACFVQNCLRFQWERLASAMRDCDAIKYLGETAVARPYALVAPYFFLDESAANAWLEINIAAIHVLVEFAQQVSCRAFAPLVISRGLLRNASIRHDIADAMRSTEVQGYLLWVDDLEEQTASRQELTALLDLSRELRGPDGREVVNLHGGYFSILAAGKVGKGALSGVAHAPEFGEFRGVVPVGGGIPIARYYIRDLHSRTKYSEALRMFHDLGWLADPTLFWNSVCDCPVCHDVLSGGVRNFRDFGESSYKTYRVGEKWVSREFPTNSASQLCLKHYLHCKEREYKESSQDEPEMLLKKLRDGSHKYEGVAGEEGVGYLRLWESIFREDTQ